MAIPTQTGVTQIVVISVAISVAITLASFCSIHANCVAICVAISAICVPSVVRYATTSSIRARKAHGSAPRGLEVYAET